METTSIRREVYKEIIDEAISKSDSVSKLIENAINFRDKSDFTNSIQLWKKLIELIPNNDYVVQQLALSIYKSKMPNESMALDRALEVIKKLNIYKSLDIETLGISGAIYKRMFKVNNNYDYLDSAIYFYKKGYTIQNDFYNGE
ncbi:MAG: TRAFs-binding domain-containing protein, partial [Erysipelotrichaceae bacterium]